MTSGLETEWVHILEGKRWVRKEVKREEKMEIGKVRKYK